MVASYIKILKSSANFTKFLEEPMKTYEWLFLFHDHLCLNNQYAAGDVVSSTRKFKIHGTGFKFFVSIFQKLEKIIIQN